MPRTSRDRFQETPILAIAEKSREDGLPYVCIGPIDLDGAKLAPKGAIDGHSGRNGEGVQSRRKRVGWK